MKDIPGQISLFDYLETLKEKDEPVDIKGAVNLKSKPISHYEVTASYGDIVLLISMCRDYVKTLDEIRGESIDWQAYYRKKFMGIADRLQEQIGYDYDAAVEKCRKKADKRESNSDIGEDALLLALKRSNAGKIPEESKEESDDSTPETQQEVRDG